VRVIGPVCATVSTGLAGAVGTRQSCCFSPTIPQKLAGIRIEPAPSVPSASGASPAATAAAAPPLDPPALASCAGSQGLRVTPKRGLLVSPFQPNSGVLVFPTMIAPAARTRAVTGASSVGTASA
jgi:hypothetical protein